MEQEDIPYDFIQISDELDFIGVTLKASYTKTRKANCEVLEDKVNKTVGPWKGGKFQNITERGHSINQYALSKVFFRCASIPLRAATIKKIHSEVRGWALQDCFVKPSALVLHRSPEDGGLGLYSVQYRALATLLRTFCELACHPNFQHSLYLSTLYRTEVLGEWCSVKVPNSPYYDSNFFNILRHYTNRNMNVATLTIKAWTTILTNDFVLLSPATDDTLPTLQPTRTEIINPTADWGLAWHLARLRGLPGDLADHMFRLLHDVLPTQERVARLGGNRGNRLPGVCRLCKPDTTETLIHCYFECPSNSQVASCLVNCIQQICPGATRKDLLLLQLEVEDQYELPIVTIISSALKTIWDKRSQSKAVTFSHIKAEIETRAHTLARSPKYNSASISIMNLLHNFNPS